MTKSRFKASIRGGSLFKSETRADFMAVTADRYASMKSRLKKKGLPPPPFSLDDFRADVLSVMGGKKDGACQCRYCMRYFVINEIAVDHATPLSRGGSLGLENLDYICGPCNDRKGGLTLDEYAALLGFLGSWLHPTARQDVLKRLEQSNKLAAGLRRSIMLAKGKQAKLPESQLMLEEEF
jgi:HNH endonuclease